MARFKGNQRFTAVRRAPAPRPHPGYVPYLNRGVVAPGEQQRSVATAAEAQRVDTAAVAGVGPPLRPLASPSVSSMRRRDTGPASVAALRRGTPCRSRCRKPSPSPSGKLDVITGYYTNIHNCIKYLNRKSERREDPGSRVLYPVEGLSSKIDRIRSKIS